MEVFNIASKKTDLLINDQIKATQVLVIGPHGEQVGVKKLDKKKNQEKRSCPEYASVC